jgi:hypothetical protein
LISTDAYEKTTTRTRTLRVIPGSGSSGNTGSSSISGKTLVARIPAGLVGKPGSLLDLPPGIAEPITFPVTLTASSSGSRALPAHPF